MVVYRELKILVTRPLGRNDVLVRRLEQGGARVHHLPLIKIEAPDSWESLDEALSQIESFAWIIFTSSNAVEAFDKRLIDRGLDRNLLNAPKFCPIGKKSAESLERAGMRRDLIPEIFTSEGVLDVLRPYRADGMKVLVVQAAGGRDLLRRELNAWGVQVHVAAAYQTLPDFSQAERLRALIATGGIDFALFASPSAVKAFAAMLGTAQLQSISSLKTLAIGPITGAELEKIGFSPTVAEEYSADGMFAVLEHLLVEV